MERISIRIIAFFTFSLCCQISFSQEKTFKNFKNEFGFQSDNDSYLAFGQDRYYTNGLFITFRHATDQSSLKETVAKKIWEAEVGHKIYNPISGKIPDIRYVDRPFAGYLYGGAAINWLYKSEHSLKASVQVGVIGPSALGEEAQTTLHNVVGFYNVEGWEYQIKNEASINTTVAYHYFIGRNKVKNTDFSFLSYANLGNTFSGAGTGFLFRTGRLHHFYNSVSTNSRVVNNPKEVEKNKNELFLFLKPQVHFVAYNGTIQGRMFATADDPDPITFGVKPFVFSQEIGINYANNRWTFNFSAVFQTREVKSTAKAHEFGMAKIYYRFN